MADARLRARVPASIPLDRFEGRAWLGIVPFRMTNVAPRAAPAVPFVSQFPELNVRTYVRIGDKPGVHFLSLDAGSQVAVHAAVHHPPWPLQAAEAAIEINTMADANGITLPDAAPLLHFAKRQDVVAWLPTRPE